MKKGKEKFNRSAGRLISELSRAAHIYFQSEFKKYSIGHAQIATLLFIAGNEGISQFELSKQLNLDKSSITSQLSILERNGYIIRYRSGHDARINNIKITDKTNGILDSLKMVFSSWTEILLEGFSDNQRAEIFNYLDKMRENAINSLDNIRKQ